MNSRPNVPNRIKTISKNVQTAIYIFAAYNFYNNWNCTSSTKYPFPARYSTVPLFFALPAVCWKVRIRAPFRYFWQLRVTRLRLSTRHNDFLCEAETGKLLK